MLNALIIVTTYFGVLVHLTAAGEFRFAMHGLRALCGLAVRLVVFWPLARERFRAWRFILISSCYEWTLKAILWVGQVVCQGWHANQLSLWLETARRPLDAYMFQEIEARGMRVRLIGVRVGAHLRVRPSASFAFGASALMKPSRGS